MNMKNAIVAVAVIAFSTSVAQAQPPQGGPPGAGGHPILGALDVDHNHELSAEEIDNATNALKALDKNKDGILNEADLGRMGPPGGGPPGDGPGGHGGGPPGAGPGGHGGGAADAGAKTNSFADRLMAFDKNKNGQIEKDELPTRMQAVMANLDGNKDDVLDKSELDELKKAASEASSSGGRIRQQAGGRGGPGGGRGGPGGPPGGGVDQMIERAFEFDKDGDGKLSREELTSFASSMLPPRGGPPGMGGPGGGPPGRGGPPGGGGDR